MEILQDSDWLKKQFYNKPEYIVLVLINPANIPHVMAS